ncbi:MAG: redoxin domain-containing protein [Nitrososphaeraceae archaeon]
MPVSPERLLCIYIIKTNYVIMSEIASKNQQQQESAVLKTGTSAPDFTLHSKPGESVSFNQFRGRPTILAFYPADFSPVCGDQMTLYNEVLPEFEKFNAQLIGISVDGVWSHLAFSKDRKLRFPILSDFEPKGEVARKYGVYRKQDGMTERALFVIDKDGIIRWSYVSPIGINPGAEGILNALESIAGPREHR